jgi:hypothetical protein
MDSDISVTTQTGTLGQQWTRIKIPVQNDTQIESIFASVNQTVKTFSIKSFSITSISSMYTEDNTFDFYGATYEIVTLFR